MLWRQSLSSPLASFFACCLGIDPSISNNLMGNCLVIEDPTFHGPLSILPGKSAVARSNNICNKEDESDSISSGNPNANNKDVVDLRQISGKGDVHIFSYNELRIATKSFRPDQILGEGGFGIVYKGAIDDSVRPGFPYTQVAVKELNPNGFQGNREWLAEVNYLVQFSHPNLVKLIGYCCEDHHRLLVYEYMACGSLEKHLFRRLCLTMPWSTRMKIALGAAKGLAFLHGAERPIIYRDFKTSNILLDSDYNAKLSDFGLAKEGPTGDQTHVSTRVMGTYGYAAPEYVMTGHLTARSDVYGFGVVLLEMLIGRRAMDTSRRNREHSLVEWARPILIHRKLLKILDPRMEGQYSIKTAQKVASLAYECLSPNPRGRPKMNQVVETLENLKAHCDNGEDLLLHSNGGVITLYEVPKQISVNSLPGDRRRPPTRTDDNNQEESAVQGRRRVKAANARSKSEPPMEYLRYIPSPESDGNDQ